MGEIMVEIVLQKRGLPEIPEEFKSIITKYMAFESYDRISLDVPLDWEGLKNGTVTQMFKAFGDYVYMALAYFTKDEDDVVTDFDGKPVDKCDVIHKGLPMLKYVKKRLRIVKIYDRKRGIFEVEGYMTNFKFAAPVVQVLKIYSVGSESGFTMDDFLRNVNVNREEAS